MTNYEKIKQMSIEELAELIANSDCTQCAYYVKGLCHCSEVKE